MTVCDVKTLLHIDSLLNRESKNNEHFTVGVVAERPQLPFDGGFSANVSPPVFSYATLNEFEEAQKKKLTNSVSSQPAESSPWLSTAWNCYDIGTLAKLRIIRKISAEKYKIAFSSTSSSRFRILNAERDAFGSWSALTAEFDDDVTSVTGSSIVCDAAAFVKRLRDSIYIIQNGNLVTPLSAKHRQTCEQIKTCLLLVEEAVQSTPNDVREAVVAQPLIKASFLTASLLAPIASSAQIFAVLKCTQIEERIRIIEEVLTTAIKRSKNKDEDVIDTVADGASTSLFPTKYSK